VSESRVRRLPAALDAPLARVRAAREDLTKAWIVRLLERASLDEIERLPTERIARELPALVSELAGAVATPEATGDGALARERAARIARLRGGDEVSPSGLARDIGALQGVLVAAFRAELGEADSHLFAEAVERLATVFAEIQAGAVGELAGERERRLEHLANTDELTGLFNVRWMRAELVRLVETQRRYAQPFALLVLDIDGLKRINDSRGHSSGDRALVAVASATRGAIRAVDSAARIGGDEFCVLAPHQDVASAVVVAERIARAVAEAAAAEALPVGVSIGVVGCPAHADSPEALLELADEAMYRAKAGGQAVAAAPPGGQAPPTRSARS